MFLLQVSTRTGIEHEESLLSESAARETSLNSQIIEMELDLKSTKVRYFIFELPEKYTHSHGIEPERGDNGLFIRLVPKVL